ncbi:hypothetical protein K491DRAFT_697387 [Lophiostoma macrostomum CBS 122681]|uniref:Azaphilone pigments biosynthesis cluster protein L N-terminal domain-containing protein n=1 Tax=Lophiostoma macrostomum CBS 122681 TaxID=1314788 RepID=A0A6A6SRQ7_9PLEO|nr:hypothetical protein K491DRAFT_697387 [Lophiostoma macrostomum CBS 122681]
MTDPLSVTAGVVGIAAAALHTIHVLIEDIENVKGAPKAITDIKSDLTAVEGSLSSLHQVLDDPEALPDALKAQIGSKNIENAVRGCDIACSDFREPLKSWTKHSTGDKTSKRDRLKIGLLKQGKIKAFTQQLASCKATVSMGLDTANFLNSCRQRRDTDAIKRMLEDREQQVAQEGALVLRNTTDMINTLEGLSISDESSAEEDGPILDEVQQEVQQELREDIARCQKQLQYFESTLTESLSNVHEERTGVKIKKVKIDDDGRALVGIINVEGEVDQIKQIKIDIEDVAVNKRAKAVVGVAKGMDINAFFK